MIWRILLTFFAATVLASAARAQPSAQPRTDSLGDPLPPGAVARLGTLRLKHNRESTTKIIDPLMAGDDYSLINKVAFTPDGKKFASLGNRVLRLWETATGKQLRGPWDASTHDCDAMAFSPDGTLMAACGLGGRGQRGLPTIHISVWDVAGAKLLKTVASTYNEGVNTVAFTDDGKTLVCAGSGAVRWWDIVTGEETRRGSHLTMERARRWSGSPTASCRRAQITLAYNFVTSKPQRKKPTARWRLNQRPFALTLPHARPFRALRSTPTMTFAYSADGKWVAVATGVGKVELRKTATGELVDTAILEAAAGPAGLKRLMGAIQALAVSGDGATIAIATNNAKAILWQPALAPTGEGKKSGKLREFSCHEAGLTPNPFLGSLAFSPDNKTLLAGMASDLQLYDVATLKEIFASEGHRAMVDYLSFSQGGKQLRSGVVPFLSFSGHPKEVITWDVASWKSLARVSSQTPKWPNIGELPPEHTVYAGELGEEHVSIFDYNTGKTVGRLSIPPSNPSLRGYGFFSPGSKVYTVFLQSQKGDPRNVVVFYRLFAIPSCKHLCDLRIKQGSIRAIPARIVFSPDDRLVAFFSESGFIEVCDTATGAVRICLGTQSAGAMNPRRDTMGNLVFSPDSRLLATWTGADDVIRIYDLKTGHAFFSLPPHGPLSERDCFAWSPDGKMLAVGHSTIQIWEVATMKLRREFDGHQGAIRSLAFSPDGGLLASGSADTTVLIWDVWGR